MSISIISFTEKGMQRSKRIAEALEIDELEVFAKCSLAKEVCVENAIQFVEQSIGEWAREQMKERNTLLFIGACGIAVRAIAPCLTDKLHDSPVLVMDEGGEYVIPILSGHMGGANEIAARIALKTGAIPVITTATDINRKFAVDLFAKKNGLHIVNKDGIAKVSSKVLAGRKITIAMESGHIPEGTVIPERIYIVSYPTEQTVDIAVTTGEKENDALLRLRPREYIIGMGCKRGKEEEKIKEFILKSIEEAGISGEQIFAVASIDKKKDEEGLLAWCRKANVPLLTFTAEQLQEQEGDFSTSAFVKEQVGVDNVCERAAIKACTQGGILIYKKHAEDGMTIAIAKREWSIVFDEQ